MMALDTVDALVNNAVRAQKIKFEFTQEQKRFAAYAGFDALAHAIEGLASVVESTFTDGIALEAVRLLFAYLPRAVNNGETDREACEKVRYASTMAFMAFAKPFPGIGHALANKLGAAFHLPRGLAHALLIDEFIRYTAPENDETVPAFVQQAYPKARTRYARIADYLGLGGADVDGKVKLLIAELVALKNATELPRTMLAAGIGEAAFMTQVTRLAIGAFEDRGTGENPCRQALAFDFETIYLRAYFGT